MKGFFRIFMALHRPFVNKLNELLSEYELSYSLWQVIFYIEKNSESTLSEISKYYNIEKPSITRRVQNLEEKNIVKQIKGKDKREKLIVLTDEGVEICKDCRKKIIKLEEQVTSCLEKEEQIILQDYLIKIRENVLNKGAL